MISALWSFCRGTPRWVLRLDIPAFWQTALTHYIWYFVLQVMWFILERKESAPPNKTKSQIHLSPVVWATCIELTGTCFILVFQSLLPCPVLSVWDLFQMICSCLICRLKGWHFLGIGWHLQNLITHTVALAGCFGKYPFCSCFFFFFTGERMLKPGNIRIATKFTYFLVMNISEGFRDTKYQKETRPRFWKTLHAVTIPILFHIMHSFDWRGVHLVQRCFMTLTAERFSARHYSSHSDLTAR